MQRVALLVVLVLAVLVNGFFAFANIVPEAPARNRGPRRYVLMQLDDDQIAWFQHNVLDEYNDEHDTNFVVRDTETHRIAEEMNAADVVLAVLPSPLAVHAAEDGLAVPFEGVVPKSRLRADLAEVVPEVMTQAQLGGRQFFLPRAATLQVGVYRISRVRDALLHWHLLRRDIDASLRSANGRGLPAGYELELDPAAWDSYDEFVLAYYWSHRSYGGKPARGRVVHRTGPSLDAQTEFLSSVMRAGATAATASDLASVPSVDWMQWETLYREEDLYADAMFVPGGLDDEDTLDGLARGRYYWAKIDEMEAFSLHGGGHRAAASRVLDEDDLGFVALPKFASLDQDDAGAPLRTAERFSFREQLMWVLPKESADAEGAYKLVRWVLDRENHARECEALGTLPLRRDVIVQRATLFREPWMQEVFSAGLSQWAGAQAIPASLNDAVGLDYAIAWDRVVNRRGAPDFERDRIVALLREPIDRAAGRESISVHAAPVDPTAETGTGGRADSAYTSGEFRLPPLREPLILDRDRARVTDDGGMPTDEEEGAE